MERKEEDKRPLLEKLISTSITNSCKIPSFIDCKFEDSHTAWNIMSDILNLITELIDYKIKSKDEMKKFYDTFMILEANFIKVKSNTLYNKCVSHINKLMYHYLDYALENEEFETVANFKAFKILKDKNPRHITKYLNK